jgi:glucosamine-6-phosphate deaminase
MILKVSRDSTETARAAAFHTADLLRYLQQSQATVRIIAAAAASQLGFLDVLTKAKHIDWKRVELFQLDEYIGLPPNHPARFAAFLRKHLVEPTGIERFHALNNDAAIAKAAAALGATTVQLGFLGIGENGHLAFNDPPASFDATEPYLKVRLDETCRRQQVGEGWFKTLEDVPKEAITVSITQLLKVERAVCVVPDLRKAKAVQACFENRICPEYPASILRAHPDAVVFLDRDSASLLQPGTLKFYSR